jgi:hypothetical protein
VHSPVLPVPCPTAVHVVELEDELDDELEFDVVEPVDELVPPDPLEDCWPELLLLQPPLQPRVKSCAAMKMQTIILKSL